MSPPRITGLSPRIVPQESFSKRCWFYANPLWYYHGPARPSRQSAGQPLYGLVDPDLRELCYLLHRHGLRTMPSCQGHFYSRRYFVEVWQQLCGEGAAIRGAGLVVRDSEDGRAYLFRDGRYRLPWRDLDQFFHDAGTHQGRGYLGLVVPRGRPELAQRLRRRPLRDRYARLRPQSLLRTPAPGWLFAIHVEAPTPTQQVRAWDRVTAYFQTLLGPSDTRCPGLTRGR